MTTFQEFRCEFCGSITNSPNRWFVIQCSDSQLIVLKWNSEAANTAGARHFCGEAHASPQECRRLPDRARPFSA